MAKRRSNGKGTYKREVDCPTGKRPYRTKNAATNVVGRMAQKEPIDGWYGRNRLAAYKCQQCKAWHVGHTPTRPT